MNNLTTLFILCLVYSSNSTGMDLLWIVVQQSTTNQFWWSLDLYPGTDAIVRHCAMPVITVVTYIY